MVITIGGMTVVIRTDVPKTSGPGSQGRYDIISPVAAILIGWVFRHGTSIENQFIVLFS